MGLLWVYYVLTERNRNRLGAIANRKKKIRLREKKRFVEDVFFAYRIKSTKIQTPCRLRDRSDVDIAFFNFLRRERVISCTRYVTKIRESVKSGVELNS